MRKKKKDKKAEEASNKAIMVSVTEEMAQPRMAHSARIAADNQRVGAHPVNLLPNRGKAESCGMNTGKNHIPM